MEDLIDLEIADPVALLREIANRYQGTSRILLEYVDNALDDAEELLRTNGGRYPYPVEVRVVIDRRSRTVAVIDNCRGMTRATLTRIVRNVGESVKRGCPWVNGRFGFGVHAFRAAAQRISFTTRNALEPCWYLSFSRDDFRGIDPPRLSSEPFPTPQETGTMVALSGFDDEWFGEVTPEDVKGEVEAHFEQLLSRPNLSIIVEEVGGLQLTCEPFDYSAVPGKTFAKVLTIQHRSDAYEVIVNLKVTDVVTHHKAMFFARGRRINEMKNIATFMSRSRHRTAVWGHDNLIGFVEVGEAVKPMITRDDFERTPVRKVLYEELVKLEEELQEALAEVNRRYENHSLGKLEEMLSAALSKLARQDALRFRTMVELGSGDLHLNTGGGSTASSDDGGVTADGGAGAGGGANGGPGEGEGPAPTGQGEGRLPGEGSGGPRKQLTETDSAYPAQRRRRSGFNIRFVDLPPDAAGAMIRSSFLEDTISINVGHPDFKDRLDRTRQGDPKVTARLVGYLAGVISIHYKDQYYARYKNQPEARAQLFDEQLDFICRLEALLIPFMKDLERMISTERLSGISEVAAT